MTFYIKINYTLNRTFLLCFPFQFRSSIARIVSQNSAYLRFSGSFYSITSGVFSREGSWPVANPSAFQHFHGACRLNPPRYIVRSRSGVSPKRAAKRVKKTSARGIKGREIRGGGGGEKLGAASKHPRRGLHLWSNCGQMTASQCAVFRRWKKKRKKTEKRERGERDCRSLSQVTHLVKTNWKEKERESGEEEENEGERGREMENGTQAHCPRDEWNCEIRSAFSKMRPKYRVSRTAPHLPPPPSSIFLFLSLFFSRSVPPAFKHDELTILFFSRELCEIPLKWASRLVLSEKSTLQKRLCLCDFQSESECNAIVIALTISASWSRILLTDVSYEI